MSETFSAVSAGANGLILSKRSDSLEANPTVERIN